MAMNFSQAMAQARAIGEKAYVAVTLVTNQPDGIVSYATGALRYYPGKYAGDRFRIWTPERLSTTGAKPLEYLFSDRKGEIAPPEGIRLPSIDQQPFFIKNGDKLGVSISGGLHVAPFVATAKFTLHSWGDATLSASLKQEGELLLGIIGDAGNHAVYLISFNEVGEEPHVG